MPPAVNITISQGVQMVANSATTLKPKYATTTAITLADAAMAAKADVAGIRVDLRRNVEQHPNCSCRHGDHGGRDGDEDEHVRTVVEPRELLAHVAIEIGVETQPRLDRNRRGDEPEAQHGERIADEQPDQDVVDRRAHGHECSADDEFGRSNVFGTIEAEEVTGAMQPVLRNREQFVVHLRDGLCFSIADSLTSSSCSVLLV